MSIELLYVLTFLQGDQGWHVIWNVILSFLCISDSRLGKLHDIIFANGEEWRLMGEGHRLQVVDIVLQFTQTHSQQSEGLADIIQDWIRSPI